MPRREARRTTEWVFGWWTLWHAKYLRKTNLFICESAWENAIAFSQLYSWMNFFREVWQQIIRKCWSFSMRCLMFDFYFWENFLLTPSFWTLVSHGPHRSHPESINLTKIVTFSDFWGSCAFTIGPSCYWEGCFWEGFFRIYTNPLTPIN